MSLLFEGQGRFGSISVNIEVFDLIFVILLTRKNEDVTTLKYKQPFRAAYLHTILLLFTKATPLAPKVCLTSHLLSAVNISNCAIR